MLRQCLNIMIYVSGSEIRLVDHPDGVFIPPPLYYRALIVSLRRDWESYKISPRRSSV